MKKDTMIETAINGILVVIVLGGFILFQGWRADWDLKCFFAHDASTCAAVKAQR